MESAASSAGKENPVVKLSITRIALSTFTVREVEMSVSTVRIREGNTFTWLTSIQCKGAVSDPFASTTRDSALIAHDKIVDHIYSNGSDVHSKYAAFVRSALVDMTETHTARTMLPPSAGRHASIVPGSLEQPTLVAVPNNVIAFPVVRRVATNTNRPGAA